MSGDPSQQQPSEAEMQAYVEQLRAADPSEIIAQAFTMLGTGAETKLGRPDARILIDAVGALCDAVEGRVPEQLVEGMRNGHAQLQATQAQAEGQGGPAPSAGEESVQPTGSPAGRPDAAPSSGQQSGGQDEPPATDRLWVPGR